MEIGCQSDVNFSKIKIENKVGVDPQSGGTLRMTSDEFFSQNKETFDLIFIDGLHIHEQVLKDIDNSLNVLNENGVILLHDCLPAKIWHQTIPQTHSSWNGDVWKSIVHSRTREDIDTYTIKADQGLGLILKRKNRDKLVHPINNFKNLKFKDYYNHHEKFMRLIDENKVLETDFKTNNLIKVVGLINNLNIIYLDLELFVNMVLRFPIHQDRFFLLPHL